VVSFLPVCIPPHNNRATCPAHIILLDLIIMTMNNAKKGNRCKIRLKQFTIFANIKHFKKENITKLKFMDIRFFLSHVPMEGILRAMFGPRSGN
jgi:hypothetical protein